MDVIDDDGPGWTLGYETFNPQVPGSNPGGVTNRGNQPDQASALPGSTPSWRSVPSRVAFQHHYLFIGEELGGAHFAGAVRPDVLVSVEP